MKTNFTLCFYEFPGALAEIKQWEDLKFNQIIEKKIFETNARIYKIKLDEEKHNGYSTEILICFPIEFSKYIISHFQILEIIRNFSNLYNVDYYKTIIFGKVDSVTLKIISSIVENFENTK